MSQSGVPGRVEETISSALGAVNQAGGSGDGSPSEIESQLVAFKIFAVSMFFGGLSGFIHQPTSKFFHSLSAIAALSTVGLFFCNKETKSKINEVVFNIQSFIRRHCPDQVRQYFPDFFTLCVIVAFIKLYLNFLEILKLLGIIPTNE